MSMCRVDVFVSLGRTFNPRHSQTIHPSLTKLCNLLMATWEITFVLNWKKKSRNNQIHCRKKPHKTKQPTPRRTTQGLEFPLIGFLFWKTNRLFPFFFAIFFYKVVSLNFMHRLSLWQVTLQNMSKLLHGADLFQVHVHKALQLSKCKLYSVFFLYLSSGSIY